MYIYRYRIYVSENIHMQEHKPYFIALYRTSKLKRSMFLEKKPVVVRRLNNTVLNDIHVSSMYMYLASVCTVGAFVWVH